MVQTQIVQQKIKNLFPEIDLEIVPMSTRGDEILDRSLTSFGGKGVFTKELEEALLSGKIDMAVHSAKDMPMEFPSGLCVGAILERADPRDVLVTMTGVLAKNLLPGSVIGTSSLRRELQIKELNPLVEIKVLRGNVQTRLNKLENGEYDGILLAAAGLERLELHENPKYHLEYLDSNIFVPAAGQGILAVEIRQGELEEVMQAIHQSDVETEWNAERQFLTELGGGCNAPCGAFCKVFEDSFCMNVMYARADGEMIHRNVQGKTLKDAKELGRELAKRVRIKTVSLVGAGPGDKLLISEKGLRCIREAEVLIYDNLVSASLLDEAPLEAELIYAGKRAANHHLRQEETNQLLVDKALEGKKVVRLKGGDPFVFGRGGEEAQALIQEDISFEIIPGISAVYGVPAYAGIPITHRDFASSFHVITGHEGNHKQEQVLDYEVLAREEGTLVFLMGLGNLENITTSLMKNGKAKDTPVAVIQQGTTARQKTVVATLDNIVEKVKEEGIKTPAVTVIGKVAGLRETLAWYENQKLFGKKVLLTGTLPMVHKLEDVLRPTGAEPISFSLIYTKPLLEELEEEIICSMNQYSWVVFTSGNGVDIFLDYLKKKRIDIRILTHLKIAVIGEGTKEALEKRGLFCDMMPSKFSSEDLAKEWIPMLGKQDRVLLLRAKEASQVLVKGLEKENITYRDIPLYETRFDLRKREELNRVIEDIDYIVFASASAVNAFAAMTDDVTKIENKIISIGPVTSKTITAMGMQVSESAVSYTAEGIRDVLVNSIRKRER